MDLDLPENCLHNGLHQLQSVPFRRSPLTQDSSPGRFMPSNCPDNGETMITTSSRIDGILLVDDDPSANKFHQVVIEGAGFPGMTRTCQSGEEALNFLSRFEGRDRSTASWFPHLLFLDLKDGFRFLSRYMRLDAGLREQVRVIMMTESLNPDDIETSIRHREVRAFMPKPMNETVLVEVMEDALDYQHPYFRNP